MSSTYENLENNQVKISFLIPADTFQKAVETAYRKGRGKIVIHGFRKGKAPRKVIENAYGEGYFYIDAINEVLPNIYEETIKELGLDIVSSPDFDIEDVSEKDGAKLTALAYIKPDINLERSQYTGITYAKQPHAEVSEEEVNHNLQQAREQNARLIPIDNRPVQNGDITTINFEGFINDIPFEGGKAEGHKLTIGSGQFIPGFEDQLIGKNIDEEITINVTFPEEYGHEELSGQPAVFKVTITEVHEKQLPELDDDLAQDISEFDTFEEFKAHLCESILKEKQAHIDKRKMEEILENLASKVEFDIPQSMIETEVDTILNSFANNVRQRGLDLETYLDSIGQTVDSIRESYQDNAATAVRIRIILEKIVQLENIEVTEEEIKEELKPMVASLGMHIDTYMENVPEDLREAVTEDVTRQKASKLVEQLAVESEEVTKN